MMLFLKGFFVVLIIEKSVYQVQKENTNVHFA